jgi:hypothetical protein
MRQRSGRPDGWTPAPTKSPFATADSEGPCGHQDTAGRRQGHDTDEWRVAVAAMTECDRAPYDDPATYADVHA